MRSRPLAIGGGTGSALDERAASRRGSGAGRADRRRRSPCRGGSLSAGHGGGRVMAAQRGRGDATAASAGSGGCGDSGRAAAALCESAFDLVVSRHPAVVWWNEIARVLRPGGAYFAQHVGPATMWELVEHFLGPQPDARARRHPYREAEEARAAGLGIVDVRYERLRAKFFDIAAAVFFLRKVIFTTSRGTTATRSTTQITLKELLSAESRGSPELPRSRPDAGRPDQGCRWRAARSD